MCLLVAKVVLALPCLFGDRLTSCSSARNSGEVVELQNSTFNLNIDIDLIIDSKLVSPVFATFSRLTLVLSLSSVGALCPLSYV